MTQKQKTLIDLNAKILKQISEEEDFEHELIDADEYMYVLDCNVIQIRKSAESLQSNENHAKSTPIRLNPMASTYTPTPAYSADMNTCAIDTLSNHGSKPLWRCIFVHQTKLGTRKRPCILARQKTQHMSPSGPRFQSRNNHRLPKLDLPYFNGDILKWQTF